MWLQLAVGIEINAWMTKRVPTQHAADALKHVPFVIRLISALLCAPPLPAYCSRASAAVAPPPPSLFPAPLAVSWPAEATQTVRRPPINAAGERSGQRGAPAAGAANLDHSVSQRAALTPSPSLSPSLPPPLPPSLFPPSQTNAPE